VVIAWAEKAVKELSITVSSEYISNRFFIVLSPVHPCVEFTEPAYENGK
jgi:hypothetical protein